MKLLKNMAIVAMTFAAVALASCGDNNKPYDPTKEAFELYNAADDKPITEGSTIEVTSFGDSFGDPEATFDLKIKYNHEEADLKATEVRNFDLTKYSSSMCVNSICVPGSKDKTQEWDLGTYYENDEKQIRLYITVSKDYQKEAAEMPVELSITDGTKTVKFNVVYKYTPAE